MKYRLKPFTAYFLLLFMFSLMTVNYSPVTIFRVNLFFLIVIFMFGYTILNIIYTRKLYLDGFFKTYLLFFLWSCLTKFWAVSDIYYSLGINTMSLTLIILFIFSNLIKSKEDIYHTIWAIAWAGVGMVLFYGFYFGFRNMIYIRLNSNITTVNANTYGLCAFFSAIGFLYIYMTNQKKLIYLILMLSMLGISLLSGSRKVLILFLIIVLGTYLFAELKKSFHRFFNITIMIFVFYILIQNNQFLYNTIGLRIEETVNYLSEDGVASNTSTGIRSSMIELGMRLFRLKPWLGYGVMGSYIYNGNTYFHNNFVELLVNTGIVGTVIYYSGFFILLKHNIKAYLYSSNFETLFFLLLLISIIFMDYSLVSYNERIVLVWLILMFKMYKMGFLFEGGRI
ncbi:O-antigen ligase family protein [Streptococcus suis]